MGKEVLFIWVSITTLRYLANIRDTRYLSVSRVLLPNIDVLSQTPSHHYELVTPTSLYFRVSKCTDRLL